MNIKLVLREKRRHWRKQKRFWHAQPCDSLYTLEHLFSVFCLCVLNSEMGHLTGGEILLTRHKDGDHPKDLKNLKSQKQEGWDRPNFCLVVFQKQHSRKDTLMAKLKDQLATIQMKGRKKRNRAWCSMLNIHWFEHHEQTVDCYQP